jgi:uncharacterized membrane protein YhaH (DUF805 family)
MFCGSALSIERHGSDVSVELAGRVLDSLEQSDAQRQEEFHRLRLTQELHAAEMRLANVQSEVRSIQRGPINAVSRNHLNELHQEQVALQKQIADLKAQLYPDVQPVSIAQEGAEQPFSWERLLWLLFTVDGRATRSEFWTGAAITILIYATMMLVMAISRAIPPEGGLATSTRTLLNLIISVQMVLFIWVGVAVGVKRFHDRDKPGWWVLIGFIPVIGLFWYIFELGLQPGSPGPNRYG